MVGKIDIGWWLSFNDLYPSLNNAVTWRQKHPSTSGHFAYQFQQLWFFKDLRALRTKFTVTFRWNLKGGVLEVETVKMFWNGFANAFPVDTKYWFMVWRQRDFLVCHFPFLEIEKKKTVYFLSPGSTCFIARHVLQETPLASSTIQQNYFDLRFFSLLLVEFRRFRYIFLW